MRLVRCSYDILGCGDGDIYSRLSSAEICEEAGRVAYASGDRIVRGESCWGFIDRIKGLGHLSVLEHYAVYLRVPVSECRCVAVLEYNPYVVRRVIGDNVYYSTNMRVIIENGLEWVMDRYNVGFVEGCHERRVTVRFQCDRGVSGEMNRHRVNSITERSTRYCNYSKAKFGSSIGVIVPSEIGDSDILDTYRRYGVEGDKCDEEGLFRNMCSVIGGGGSFDSPIDLWVFSNLCSEWSYMGLLRSGWTPQQARRVLPLDLHSELVHSAFVRDWWHLFRLRCSSRAHPDIRALIEPLMEEFIRRDWINTYTCVAIE